MKADIDCLPEPQLRFPIHQLSGRVGKRSGNLIRVPQDQSTLQAALNALTGYGDTIQIAASYTETLAAGPSSLIPPDSRPWTIDDSTPRMPPGPASLAASAISARAEQSARVAQSARKVAGEPSYVLITTDGVLPEITTRVITLPTGEKVKVLEETAKVNETHYAQMPTIQASPSGWYLINCGFSITFNRVPSRFAWRGIRFLGSTVTSGDAPCFFWLGGPDSGNPSVWHQGRGEHIHCDHWIFNQCAWQADPLNVGTSVGTVVDSVPPWFAMVNCFADKLWTFAGGDGKLFSPPLGPGHVENCDIRGGCGAMWFTGGGGSPFVGDTASNWVIRRNWYYAPLSWLPSEPHPNFSYMTGFTRGGLGPYGTVTINVSAGGVATSTDVTDFPGEFEGANPEYNPVRSFSIFYELATGRARSVASCHMYGGGHHTNAVQFNAAWPGGAASNLIGVFQYAHPDLEISPTLYNSGLDTPMPTATTNTSTRHVVLSVALPQYIADEVAAGHYPFFYLNNTFWQAWNGDPPPINVQTFGEYDARHNAWGYQLNVTYAQSRRKKIVAVDSDRMGFTFDSTQNLFAAGETFPYSVVRADGLRRHVIYHNKGSFENKTGTRWIFEGNVHDVGWYNNRVYALDQTSAGFIGAVIIAGDIATLQPGVLAGFDGNNTLVTPSTWPVPVPDWAGQCGLGSPWYNIGLLASSVSGNALEYASSARWIDRVINATTLRLHRQDPRWPTGQQGDGSYTNMFWVGTSFPWCQIGDTVMRYNILNGGSPLTVYAESQYESKMIPGGDIAVHNNLYLRGQGTQYAINTVPTGPPNGGGPITFSPGGQAVYDEPPPTGQQGRWRFDHNTAVRPHHGFGSQPAGIIMGAAITAMPAPSNDISVSDNIFPDANGLVAPFVKYPDAQADADMTATWHPVTTRCDRNIIEGTGLMDTTFPAWSGAATNSHVAGTQAIGWANYANGELDGYNLANYALVPIYTTGTVAIAADGITVTHEGSDFPSYVQAGQWFKTVTSGALRKVATAGGVLGVNWTTYTGAHAFLKRSGIARPQGGGPPLAFQTHTQALGNDQWVEATNLTGSRTFGLGIRCSATLVNGYAMDFQVDGYNHDPYSILVLYRIDNGIRTQLNFGGAGGNGNPAVIAAGDVIRLTVVGTTVRATRNGLTCVTWDTAGDSIKYTTGRAGLVSFANDSGCTVGSFSCGNDGSGASATDSFTGGNDQVQLENVYPESNVTGKSFVFTFQGTASDGTDPGCDLATLALMTAGVRNPARAHF